MAVHYNNWELRKKIDWLMSKGLSPLPVVPSSPGLPPMFNGKCPSYFIEKGIPTMIRHAQYQTRQPTKEELDEWFRKPGVGVGALPGSSKATVIDIDRKHFNSQNACNDALKRLLKMLGEDTYHERTKSGGYHILVRFKEQVDFTNFGMDDIPHVGELLKVGRFCVMSPTKDYVHRAGLEIRDVSSPRTLGLYATKEAKKKDTKKAKKAPDGNQTQPHILGLITKKNLALATGGKRKCKDASKVFVGFLQDVYGWENFCTQHKVSVLGVEDVISNMAFDLGIETDRADRIKAGIPKDMIRPALMKTKGKSACEKKLESAIKEANPTAKATPIVEISKASTTSQELKKHDRKTAETSANEDFEDNRIVIDLDDTPGTLAWKHLYEGKDHVFVAGNIYRFVGTHFELMSEARLRGEILALFERCIQKKECKEGSGVPDISRPFATAHKVRCALDCVRDKLAVVAGREVNDLNPKHLNLTNGVLKLNWSDDGTLTTELVPHSPEFLFIEEPKVRYDPDASREHLDTFLKTLEAKYQSIFLQTLAASIDLNTIRERQHRAVRILVLLGSGSNGKDAWRVALTLILGRKCVKSVPISDYVQYDQGRKFGLVALAGCKVNWASENSFTLSLDGIESLKANNTGDPMIYERKGKDSEEFIPGNISVFNGNAETIKIKAGNEAIRSRYAFIPLEKTFKKNPDPNDPNELEADPNFRNEAWLAEHVCPALVNELLIQLQKTVKKGIDYTATDKVLEAHTLESFHLKEFFEEEGVVSCKGGCIVVSELHERLENYYVANGVLTRDEINGIPRFLDEGRPGDKYIKSPQALTRRVKEFYPQITTGRRYRSVNGATPKRVRTMEGIAFKSDLEKTEKLNEGREKFLTEPAQTEPTPTEPTPTEPTPTEPIPVEPTLTEPVQTELKPTEPTPIPVEPTPTEPTPVEPIQTEPIPVEPTPVEPIQTEPPELELNKDDVLFLDELGQIKDQNSYTALREKYRETITPERWNQLWKRFIPEEEKNRILRCTNSDLR